MNSKFLKKVVAAIFTLSCILSSLSFTVQASGTTLYSFDFANVPANTYNITTIQSAQGVDLSGATLTQADSSAHTVNYIVENGLGKFTGSNTTGGGLWQNLTFNQAVTDGAIYFDVVFDKSASRTISNRDTTLFNIWSGGNNFSALTLDGPSGTNNPNVLFVGTDANRTTFKDGSDNLSKAGVHNLRIVVMRENDQTDWTFKLYDMDVSSTQEILETTLSKDTFPSITKVNSGVYIGGSENGTTPVIAFKKLSAVKMSYAEANKVNVTLPAGTTVNAVGSSLTISFSGAVDPATLSNITFAAADGVNKITSRTPAADNLSATIALGALTDGETYTLTVPATVTDLGGIGVIPASKMFLAELVPVTVTLPIEDRIGAASPELTISFSAAVEPLTLSNITFKGEDDVNRIASVTPGVGNMSADIILSELEDGVYTLSVPEAVKDVGGNAVVAASKQITVDSNLDSIFSFDYANVPNGNYTVDTIKTAQGVYLNGATLAQGSHTSAYNVAGGVGTFTGQNASGGNLQQNLTFTTPITSGAVAFDIAFNKEGSRNIGNRSTGILSIKSATKDFGAITLTPASSGTDPSSIVVGTGHLGSDTRYDFLDGTQYYAEDSTYNYRAVIMRSSDQQDWTYVLYDMDISDTAPIFKSVLPKADYPSITSVGFNVYIGGAATGDQVAVAFTKYSAKMLPYELPVVGTNVDVTDDIVVTFTEAITPSEDATYKIKDGVEFINATAQWSQDGTELTLVPEKYLEKGTEYQVILTGMDGADGLVYDSEIPFNTASANLKFDSSTAYAYKDAGGSEVAPSLATSVSTDLSLTNISGGTHNVMAVFAAYDGSGVLLGVGTTAFDPSFDGDPIPVSITGEAGFLTNAVSFKLFALEKTGDIITKIN